MNSDSSGRGKNLATEEPKAFDPILKIGGCYVFPFAEDSLAGIVVTSAFRELDEEYYRFLLSGKYFHTVPSIKEFKNAGYCGRKLSATYTTSGYVLSYYCITIKRSSLEKSVSKLKLIDSIPIAKDIDCGTIGYCDSLPQLAREFTMIEASNNQKDPMVDSIYKIYPTEIFPFSTITLARKASELSVPYINWVFSPADIHASAATMMTESWWWDLAHDLTPFGNDDGFDALYGFRDWRLKNPKAEAAAYIAELEKIWGSRFIHLGVTLEKDLPRVERSNQFYRNVDRSVIAVSLAQIALEGTISEKLKTYGLNALTRAMTEYSLHGMDQENKEEYILRLKKMKEVLNSF